MTTTERELIALMEETLAQAYGKPAQLRSHDLEFVVESLGGSETSRDLISGGFARKICLAAAVARRQRRGPTLVLLPGPEVEGFIDDVKQPLERLGLQLGFDLIVYGLLDFDSTTDSRTASDCDYAAEIDAIFSTDAEPDDNYRQWSEVGMLDPALVVLLGRVLRARPARYSSTVDSWLRGLPPTVPVVRCWERSRSVAREVEPSEPRLPSTSPIEPADRILRQEESSEIAAQLLRPRPPIVSITGRPGSGRTTLLAEVAAQLRQTGQPMVLRPLLPCGKTINKALQDTAERLAELEASVPEVVVIDDFDVETRLSTSGPDHELFDRLLQLADLGWFRFLLVLNESRLDRLADVCRDLAEAIVHVRPEPLPDDDVAEIVRHRAFKRIRAAGLRIDDEVLPAALAPVRAHEALAQPGLGIARVEAALGRARREKASELTKQHLDKGSAPAAPTSATEMKLRLRERIRGQDAAIDLVAERLTPALVGLKLRPERPHGVFLFAGPSGCGKTETAKQLAQVVYGSSDAIVRLDMSEFADEKDARMKLIGASRIWKDSTTEGLLTTKVNENPRSVVLLDEFEKAHPQIWSLFLQVFDEGRLTDGWGNVASFAETIIVMTSNLGVKEGSARAAGFGTAEGFDSERQHAAITSALPPEFINRISATIGFDSLSQESIRELAEMELDRAFDRFSEQGWRIEHERSVAEWVAAYGYDSQYGARHLQRNIETEVLPLLASAPSRRVRVGLGNSGLTVSALN